jgi:hypothetical protein
MAAAMLTSADVLVPNRLEVQLDAGIRLLGYGIETAEVEPGGLVDLTLYWQADAPIQRRYKVFTHLLGDAYNAETNGFVWGQQDNEPAGDTRPTSTWRAGEVIEDPYAIVVAAHAPAGAYEIELGMYDPASGERVPVLDDAGVQVADRIVLPPVTVGTP